MTHSNDPSAVPAPGATRRAVRSASPLLNLILGLWLGGSFAMLGVVIFNFAGFERLFERNPPLAQRAGFDARVEAAKKSSLLWVHASELNRVYFEVWTMAQLGLGGIAFLAALFSRQGKTAMLAILPALGLVALAHFYLIPEITRVGRTLDFAPRDPPPPQYAEFERLHKISTGADMARMALVLFGVGLALAGKKQRHSGEA